MNGVCVCWRGWVDLERLDGVGCLEFDEERAAVSVSLIMVFLEAHLHENFTGRRCAAARPNRKI